MILRHAREAVDGQPLENSFEAIEERSGRCLGSCTIYTRSEPLLFPARPFRVSLDFAGDPVPDALVGAAVARAKEICTASGEFTRMFAPVAPADTALGESLSALGFRDNDGLIRMTRAFPVSEAYELPAGCVLVRDQLDEPIEQKFFLERYNSLYARDFGYDWLQTFRDRPGFERLLVVSPTGMAGELICWQRDDNCVIEWLQVARRWRRMGVALALLTHLCRDASRASLPNAPKRLYHEQPLPPMQRAEAEVQARVPNLLALMETAGFAQETLLCRYPGIDIDPE